MLRIAVGIILLALGRKGVCQSTTPSAQLVVEEDVGFWIIGNETYEISSLEGFNRVSGVTNDSDLALEVEPGKFSILYRSSEGECISNIIWCEDRQMTFSFWIKVVEWRESGTQYIIRTSNIITETGFVVLTVGDDPVKVFFNGDDTDYEYYIDRDVLKEWTFLAAVIDTDIRSMKVYINGTQLPDSELELTDNPEDTRGRFTIIGQHDQVPNFYFAGFKIFYTALSQDELENMFRASTGGTASSLNETTLDPGTMDTATTTTVPLTSNVMATTDATALPQTTQIATAATREIVATDDGMIVTAATREIVATDDGMITKAADTTQQLESTQTIKYSTMKTSSDITNTSITVVEMQDTTGCELQKSITKIAYIGWPTSISCRSVVAALRWRLMNSEMDSESVTCSIVDGVSNATLHSKNFNTYNIFAILDADYVTPDITWNSTKTYYVLLKTNSTCLYDSVTLNLTETVETTCNQSLESSRVIPITTTKGKMISLACEVPRSVKSKINRDDGLHDFTVTWYRNCSILKAGSTDYEIRESELVIPSPDFDIAGTYSCSINYKGSQRFLSQFGVCVKPPSQYSEPILRCPSSVSAVEGNSASITCQVDIGFTVSQTFFSIMVWQQVGRNDGYSCRAFGEKSQVGWHGRANCFSNFTEAQEHNKRCFSYKPSESDQRPMKNIYNVTLTIRDIQASDFGSYLATFNSISVEKNKTITLIRDRSQEEANYIYIIIGLSVVIALVVFAIIIACFVRCTRKQSRIA